MTDFPFDRPIAHRGLHDATKGIVENSESAFKAAIARGFSIECDLQLTADGEAVVFHDSDILRLTGQDGDVIETEADALCALPLLGSADEDRPVRFSDLLAGVNGSVPLIVEVKQQEYPYQTRALTQKLLADIPQYTGQIAFMSFDPLVLNILHGAGFRGPLGIVTYDYRDGADHLSAMQRFMLRNVLHRAASHFTFISCERAALTMPRIRLMRALGTKVMTWTIRSAEEAAAAAPHADQIVFEGFDPDT